MDQLLVVPALVHDSDNGGTSSKTQKVSVVNGYIVYTRAKRHRNLCNEISESEELKRFRVCEDAEANAELPAKVENRVEFCMGRDNDCNKLKRELEEDSRKVAVVRTFKRCRRPSALKDNVVSNGEPDGGGVNGSGSGITRNKLELKMSKKIVVNKRPMTVTELFHTGLLDGVSVVYMGGIKKVRFDMTLVLFQHEDDEIFLAYSRFCCCYVAMPQLILL